MQYGGFWRRFIAFSIDKTFLGALTAGIMSAGFWIIDSPFIPEHLDYGNGNFSAPLRRVLFMYCLISVILSMVYYTYFHGVTGQTIGKKIMGLRVVRETGEPLTLGPAFLRWIGYFISKIFLYLGFIWIAFHPRKRGWHDMIAGTVVVRWPERVMPVYWSHAAAQEEFGKSAPAENMGPGTGGQPPEER
ncbi:MAG: RDD family protein [Deltaproteobacteria bacterium]|nr:RDD family protein [Deltaproteobacteria bacterium]